MEENTFDGVKVKLKKTRKSYKLMFGVYKEHPLFNINLSKQNIKSFIEDLSFLDIIELDMNRRFKELDVPHINHVENVNNIWWFGFNVEENNFDDLVSTIFNVTNLINDINKRYKQIVKNEKDNLKWISQR